MDVHKPLDVATNHTLSFVTAHISKGAQILEVGCGEGDVALALQEQAFHPIAIDSDKQALRAAAEKGVNTLQADWPIDLEQRFDAVLFSRSLHHIHVLQPAIETAGASLHTRGVLLVEDFACDEIDSTTVQWLYEVLREELTVGSFQPVAGTFIHSLLNANNPMTAWRDEHHHDLHTIGVMKSAIEGAFTTATLEVAPYLYRYVIPSLPVTVEGGRILTKIFEKETAAISSNAIVGIGRRIIARN